MIETEDLMYPSKERATNKKAESGIMKKEKRKRCLDNNKVSSCFFFFVKFRPLPWYNGEEGAHSLEQIQNLERLLGELGPFKNQKESIYLQRLISVSPL